MKTNLVPEFYPSLPKPFDWGNTSPESEHLALAVLDRFLPPLIGEQVDINGDLHMCSIAAWTLHLPFLADVVAHMGRGEAWILGREIWRWIARNAPYHNLRPRHYCLKQEAP